MNIRINVESRTFHEFYPDAMIRQQVHYAFAHTFLPQYVHQNPYAFFSYLFRQDLPGGVMEPNRFIHSRWTMFEKLAGLIPREAPPFEEGVAFRRVLDLTMSIQDLAGRPLALVKMPAPECSTDAFFVAAALLASPNNPETWPRDVEARVFTLEAHVSDHAGQTTTWMVCEWTKERAHKNFGLIVAAEQDAFLQAITTLLHAPDAPVLGGFTRGTDGTRPSITLAVEVGQIPPPQAAPEAKQPWWKIW